MWPPTSYTGQPRVLETLVVKNATTHLCCIFRLQLWFPGDSITALLMLSCTVLLLLHISTVSLVPGFVSLSGTSCSKLGSLPTLLSGVFTEGVVMLWGVGGCSLEGVGQPRSKTGGAGLLLVQTLKAFSSLATLLTGERKGPSCGWHCRVDVHCGQNENTEFLYLTSWLDTWTIP